VSAALPRDVVMKGLKEPCQQVEGADPSQNHRIIGWKRPLRSSSPTIDPTPPCLLNHTLKCHIYTFFEHLQGWWSPLPSAAVLDPQPGPQCERGSGASPAKGRDWSGFHVRRGWGSWDCSAWRGECSGEPYPCV